MRTGPSDFNRAFCLKKQPHVQYNYPNSEQRLLCNRLFINTTTSLTDEERSTAGNIVHLEAKTHILCSINFFCCENRAAYATCGKKWKGGVGHRRQYGACALRAGFLKLRTHTHTHSLSLSLSLSEYVILITFQ